MSAYQGGSSSMACFELKPDGTYTYNAESSRSVSTSTMYGGTASQSSDAGRWSYKGNQQARVVTSKAFAPSSPHGL